MGLSLKSSKTKTITTCVLETPLNVDVAGGIIEVMFGHAVHKYLGRHLCGNAKLRSSTEFDHRLAAAWAKIHKHRPALMNKHVSTEKRVKLLQCDNSYCFVWP